MNHLAYSPKEFPRGTMSESMNEENMNEMKCH